MTHAAADPSFEGGKNPAILSILVRMYCNKKRGTDPSKTYTHANTHERKGDFSYHMVYLILSTPHSPYSYGNCETKRDNPLVGRLRKPHDDVTTPEYDRVMCTVLEIEKRERKKSIFLIFHPFFHFCCVSTFHLQDFPPSLAETLIAPATDTNISPLIDCQLAALSPSVRPSVRKCS